MSLLYDASARRSTRSATRTRRTRSRSSTTGPRSDRAARRRCSTPTARGDHGPAPVHDHADRARRLGPDLEPPRGTRRRSTRHGCGDVVRMHLRSPDVQLRPYPWQPKRNTFSSEGNDLGVPSRVFPQWLRCTGCDMLGLLSQFGYTNTHPFRTDLACFEHTKCTGRPSGEAQGGPPHRHSGPVPARLRGRAPGRVPVRPVGPPRQAVPEGGVPRPEDDRPDRRQGRVGDDPLRVLRAAAADERGPGPGGRGEAAQVPGPPPSPGRVRAGAAARDQADADRRVQPVVPRHPVDHRDAGVAGGEGQRPGRPDPGRARRPARKYAGDLGLSATPDGKVDVTGQSDDSLPARSPRPWRRRRRGGAGRALLTGTRSTSSSRNGGTC